MTTPAQHDHTDWLTLVMHDGEPPEVRCRVCLASYEIDPAEHGGLSTLADTIGLVTPRLADEVLEVHSLWWVDSRCCRDSLAWRVYYGDDGRGGDRVADVCTGCWRIPEDVSGPLRLPLLVFLEHRSRVEAMPREEMRH